MKKLLFFTVVIGFFVSLNAQETQKIVIPQSQSRDMLKVMDRVPFTPKDPTFLNNSELKKVQKDGITYTEYGQVASGEFAVNFAKPEQGTVFSKAMAISLFPDSLVSTTFYKYEAYPDSVSLSQGFPGVGFIFDPYSKGFSASWDKGLFEDNSDARNGILFGYRIDTVTIPAEYRRTDNYTGNDDTLRVYVSYHEYYNRPIGVQDYVIYYFTDDTTTRGLSTLVKYVDSIPEKGSACVPASTTMKVFDYILTASDATRPSTAEKGMIYSKPLALPLDGGFEVPAGHVASIMVKFIPSYDYNKGDTSKIIWYDERLPEDDQYTKDTVLKNTLYMLSYNVSSTDADFDLFMDHGMGVNGRITEDKTVRYNLPRMYEWMNNTYAFTYYLFPIIYLNLSVADNDTILRPPSTGIESVTDVVSGIYPNPVTSELTVRLKEEGQADVAIYNILGQKVQQTTIYDVENTVPVADLSAGLYVLKVTQNGRTHTIKITKK
jgi:hypothetical protein